MARARLVALGLFDEPEWARHAQAALKAVGFATDDIALLEPNCRPARRALRRSPANTGAISAALAGRGMPEHQAQYYEREVQRGNSLLAVRTRATNDLAETIMGRFGAYDVQPFASRINGSRGQRRVHSVTAGYSAARGQ